MAENTEETGYTVEQYKLLKAAIATGARSIYYGNKRIDYNSYTEMKQQLYDMGVELGLIKVASGRVYPVYNKGLERINRRGDHECDR